MITIVDYGVGNPAAIVNMLEFIGHDSCITREPSQITGADHLILPGVGAFDAAMNRLRDLELTAVLDEAVLERKVPLLGVCLGMQLLGRRSEEGNEPGLGWIAADSVRMMPDLAAGRKVPFMGWAEVVSSASATLFDPTEHPRYYFSHSYQMQCDEATDVAAHYVSGQPVVCAVQNGNVYGVQFHPEKSHRFGMKLLSNFVEKSR